MTDRIRKAAELLSIQLLDHVIVAADSHTSFLDAGILRGPTQDTPTA